MAKPTPAAAYSVDSVVTLAAPASAPAPTPASANLKIKLKRSVVVGGVVRVQGDIVDILAREAKQFIARGQAEPLEKEAKK